MTGAGVTGAAAGGVPGCVPPKGAGPLLRPESAASSAALHAPSTAVQVSSPRIRPPNMVFTALNAGILKTDPENLEHWSAGLWFFNYLRTKQCLLVACYSFCSCAAERQS